MRASRGKERRRNWGRARGADEAGDAEERRREPRGVFGSNARLLAADYWGDFPICHWVSWAFLEPNNLCWVTLRLRVVTPLSF